MSRQVIDGIEPLEAVVVVEDCANAGVMPATLSRAAADAAKSSLVIFRLLHDDCANHALASNASLLSMFPYGFLHAGSLKKINLLALGNLAPCFATLVFSRLSSGSQFLLLSQTWNLVHDREQDAQCWQGANSGSVEGGD